MPFSEHPFGILTRHFAHLLPVYIHVTLPKGMSLSLIALLIFFCNHIVISHVHTMLAERNTVSIFAMRKTLSFKQHNKQFVNHCEYSKCPPPAFTHAFSLWVKFLTVLLIGPCGTLSHNISPAVPASVQQRISALVTTYGTPPASLPRHDSPEGLSPTNLAATGLL